MASGQATTRGLPLRPVLLLLHRWAGLVAGLWLFTAALTGAIMVFTDEIDHGLNPDLYTSSVGPTASADAIAASVVGAFPGYAPNSINLPDHPGESTIVFMRPAPGSGMPRVSREIFVDSVTAKVIGVRDRDALEFSRPGFTRLVIKLHYTLLMNDMGQWIFGLVALLWLLGHVVSVVLAFPSIREWKASFVIPRGARGYKFNFRAHRALALWFFPVTTVLALSAVYLNWNADFRAITGTVLPITKSYDQTRPKGEGDFTPPIGVQQAVDLASRHAPGAMVDGVSLMLDKDLYRVRLFDRRDIDPTRGQRNIYIDSQTGAVRADEHIAGGAAGDVLLAWQFPLHSGKAFGWPGRIVIFLAGIVICLCVITGYAIYFRKRAVCRERLRKQAALGQPLPAE